MGMAHDGEADAEAEVTKPLRAESGVQEEGSVFGPEESVAVSDIGGGNAIWWGLGFVNMATIWAYQTLITAQDVYKEKFPDANIAFWGTVVYGIALVVAHVANLVFSIETHLSFKARVIPGFMVTALIGTIVIIWQTPALIHHGGPAVILIAFGLTGVVNTFISGPLYAIAGLFPTGAFTGAVNIGNAWAGVLTVVTETVIRLIFKASHSGGNPYTFTMYLFTGIMVAICIVAILVFLSTIRVPVCAEKIRRAEEARLSGDRSLRIDTQRLKAVWETIKELKYPAISQFWVFFVSLALWPGIPCATKPDGWFATYNGDWLCSPFIVGAFNVSDFLGRVSTKWFERMSMETCMWLSLSRTLLVVPVVLSVDPMKIKSNWVLIVVLFVVGWSNGLLSTLSMMKGPRIASRPELGAYVMVLFLYLGIACGAITAAVLNRNGWPKTPT